ncbi:MAG: CDP-glycerol glycerophosphotransferase family protein [Melioribacter sp.]|nr:CDP-glycerol glycerophosphotransferase family protein [Melioribacter sp.]
MKKKILFICGSLNQTTMMHKISMHLQNYDCYFTPYYADGFLGWLAKKGVLDFTILGGNFKKQTEEYLRDNNLTVDYKGLTNNYDLVYTCADLIVPKNIRNKKVILVQEGMTDPENFAFYLVKYFNFPRWIASTSTMGMSDMYDIFCVASEGYKELFIRKGVKPEKIVVTGIPNFDNANKYLINDFPYKNYVLVATSDARETFKYENRKKFIKECLKIANGRQLIFKLHPNEKYERAAREINKYAPGAIIFKDGNINHMIANCDVLITKYSSVVYIGLALGKEVYSSFDINELKRLMPIQNNGTSAERIARIGIYLLEEQDYSIEEIHNNYELKAV